MTIKYNVVLSTKFKKDYKRCQKSGLNMTELAQVVHFLECGETLPAKYKDHALKGDLVGTRECHIHPDWLLIYEINEGDLILTLVRTGSNAQLFNM